MKSSLGQPIIVENVAGAGGTIGSSRGVRAAADGYTLTLGNWTSHVGGPAVYPLQYDVLKDFEPVARLTDLPMMMIGNAALPANDMKELVAWLKTNPKGLSAATIGVGSPAHLCLVHFQNSTGTHFPLVPYRGGSAAIQDVIAGHVELMCGEGMNILPHVRSGNVKAYAVMSKTRWFASPDIPTAEESGVTGMTISFWSGLWVPKGTPKDTIDRLGAAVREALADPSVRQKLTDFGNELPPPERQTPTALYAHHKAEIEKWWPIIKAANIKPD
jgi:tripartite-type tricarboxylate transporter receptor subunit TctC